MDPIAVRPARTGDIADILDLWLRSGAEPTHTDDAASLENLLDHDPGALLVASDGGGICGSVIAAWDGWRGSVYRLVVDPDRRHAGLGRRLVTEAERRLAARGATRMQAIVVESESAAVGFWRAAGWEQQAGRLRFVTGWSWSRPARHLLTGARVTATVAPHRNVEQGVGDAGTAVGSPVGRVGVP